jgi:PAS domain S-box-containing protein
METGEDPPVILRSLYNNTGKFRSYEMHRSLIRDSQGRPTGMRMLCVDVTEARRALGDAIARQQWLESVVQSLSAAVLVTDALGFVRAVNPEAESLLGWKAADLIGQVIERAIPLLSPVSSGGSPLNFTMSLEARRSGIATILDRARRELRVEIVSSPILDRATGLTTGVVSLLRRADAAP